MTAAVVGHFMNMLCSADSSWETSWTARETVDLSTPTVSPMTWRAGVKRRTPNAECRTPNAERRMHCLLAVSFTCVCLRLAFICWKGPTTIKCCPFQQIKANRKQTQVKLTASKQCIRRSAFCIRRSAFGVLPLPGGSYHSHKNAVLSALDRLASTHDCGLFFAVNRSQ